MEHRDAAVNSHTEKKGAAESRSDAASESRGPEPLSPFAPLQEATRRAEMLRESAVADVDGITRAGFAYVSESEPVIA
jgi:hypothetical protein